MKLKFCGSQEEGSWQCWAGDTTSCTQCHQNHIFTIANATDQDTHKHTSTKQKEPMISPRETEKIRMIIEVKAKNCRC